MDTLVLTQIILSIAFTLAVLLQKKSTWFSWAIWWAYADNKSFYWNKRWFAAFLHKSSVVLAVALFTNALLFVFI